MTNSFARCSAVLTHTPIAALTKGRVGSVMLVSDPKKLSSSVKSLLKAHDRSIHRVDFVGKKAVVSNGLRRQVRLLLK